MSLELPHSAYLQYTGTPRASGPSPNSLALWLLASVLVRSWKKKDSSASVVTARGTFFFFFCLRIAKYSATIRPRPRTCRLTCHESNKIKKSARTWRCIRTPATPATPTELMLTRHYITGDIARICQNSTFSRRRAYSCWVRIFSLTEGLNTMKVPKRLSHKVTIYEFPQPSFSKNTSRYSNHQFRK
jgi:hypothetical protein